MLLCKQIMKLLPNGILPIIFFLFPEFIWMYHGYIEADPFYLITTENKMFNNNNYKNLDIRPFPYNDTIKIDRPFFDYVQYYIKNQYYYNDNAPNLENTSDIWAGKGSTFFTSIHFDFQNKYLITSIEPFYTVSENLSFNTYHTEELFLALNDGPAHLDRPYTSYGIRESQIMLHYNGLGAGISNTNMWWGPGIHSSLNMTNNTSGFPYLMLGTVSEMKMGNSGIHLRYIYSELDDKNPVKPNYTALLGSYTYYSYPVVTIGFYRTFLSGGNQSWDGVSRSDAMLQPFQPFFKKTLFENNPDNFKDAADQFLSGSISILFPESKLKLHLEFGRNDHAWDIYDLRAMPNHSSASQIGFRKIGLFEHPEVIFGFEYTNLVSSPFYAFRSEGHWFNKYFFEYNTYNGRRWAAHSGSDSDDLIIYSGYLSEKQDLIISINYERHGIIEGIKLTDMDDPQYYNNRHFPEVKIELKCDYRIKLLNYNLFFFYEYEFEENLGLSMQSISNHRKTDYKKANVFGLGFIRKF